MKKIIKKIKHQILYRFSKIKAHNDLPKKEKHLKYHNMNVKTFRANAGVILTAFVFLLFGVMLAKLDYDALSKIILDAEHEQTLVVTMLALFTWAFLVIFSFTMSAVSILYYRYRLKKGDE